MASLRGWTSRAIKFCVGMTPSRGPAPSESMARDVIELLRDVPLSQPLTPTPTAGAAARGGVPAVSPDGSSSPAGRSRRLERLQGRETFVADKPPHSWKVSWNVLTVAQLCMQSKCRHGGRPRIRAATTCLSNATWISQQHRLQREATASGTSSLFPAAVDRVTFTTVCGSHHLSRHEQDK